MKHITLMIKRKLLLIIAALSVLCCIIIVRHNYRPAHRLSYAVFRAKSGWGYNILVDTSLFIHQDIVPTLTTEKGFDTQKQAILTAQLVVDKIKSGKLPTVSKSELQTILTAKEGNE